MGNALKTSLVGFQPHGAEKSPLGALTLGSEPPQGGIFKGENGVHWRPKKKFVTKTMDEKHNENMFFVFTTIFDPLGLPHPLLKAPNLGTFQFFRDFFLDLAYGLSHTPHATQDLYVGEHLFSGLCGSKID